MNITHEGTGELAATIKIKLGQVDYQDKVSNSLKDLQKKSTLKGFRPGKVPYGLVKKMYEKSVIAEEVNKLLSENLNKYITDQNLEILGYPLGNDEKNNKIDFETDTDFEFYFDIAFVPSFSLDISENTSMDYYDITVEEKFVDNYLEDTRKRHGKFIESEAVGDGDIIKGVIAELDETGQIKEGGINTDTSVLLTMIKDDNIKQHFIGRKAGDKIVFNPLKATGNIIETNAMLGLKKEESEKAEGDFEFTISTISRVELAPLDTEFFKKIYPEDEIQDEKKFREKLAHEAKKYYQTESDHYFVHTTMEKLVNETQFNLADDFIKRWLVDSDKNLTPESVEKNYHMYVKSLRQQLIVNRIMKDHNIKVDEQEMKDHIRNIFINRYFINPADAEKSKQLDTIVESVLKNKEETGKIYDELFDNKVKELFKSRFSLVKKEITYSDFINLVNEHHKVHHHEHE